MALFHVYPIVLCRPGPGNSFSDAFNGLAIFDGRRLVSFDIFGNREVYQYYFDKLSLDALGRVRLGPGNTAMKKSDRYLSFVQHEKRISLLINTG